MVLSGENKATTIKASEKKGQIFSNPLFITRYMTLYETLPAPVFRASSTTTSLSAAIQCFNLRPRYIFAIDSAPGRINATNRCCSRPNNRASEQGNREKKIQPTGYNSEARFFTRVHSRAERALRVP